MTDTIAADTQTTPKHGKNAFFFVIVAVVLNMISFGIIMPVMPDLLVEVTGKDVDQIAIESGLLAATFAVANFFAMPILGGLSDAYGRRPVLLASIAMLGVDLIIMGLAPTLAVLFLGRFLGGLFSATYSVANAYIADVTEPEERGRAFGMMGAAFGIGFILGPVFGGLLGGIDTRLPFFVAAGIAGLNFLYGLFVLPESLPAEDRRPFTLARANPFGAFKHFAKLPKVAWFIVAIGLYHLAHMIYPATWHLHGAVRYGWDSVMIGISLGVVGLGSAIGQAFLTGYLIKRLGAMKAAFWGLSMNAVALTLFAFANAPWMAFAVIAVSALGGVAMPAIQTITSTLTPKNAQGELQGAQASMQAFTMIFSPVLMTSIFSAFSERDADYFVAYFPGAAFLMAAIFILIAMIPFLIGVRMNRTALVDTDAAAMTDAAA
jgi:DHA1 family tetracycline resistance protein-like MFS transporter